MADQKLHELTEDTSPSLTDIVYEEKDPAGTPLDRKLTWSTVFSVLWALATVAATGKTTPVDADLFLIVDSAASNVIKKLTFANLKLSIVNFIMAGRPDGSMWNGKISVSVASNDITVALKTSAGADASSTDPIYVKINGTLRTCTAALSKTLADGTNWFNSGAAELGTREIDYFVYLIWNTTPATDIVDLGFSRIPYGNVYSDFSGTSTNEKYLAFANASTPTSTDDVVVVGRFAATLSLTGTGHLWTVPTYTSTNLIQRPIYETRDLNFTLVAANLTQTSGTATAVYKRRMTDVTGHVEFVFGASSAISGDVTFTPPVTQGTYGATLIPVGISRLFAGAAGYHGMILAASTTSFRLVVNVASGTYLTNAALSSTIPGTWTTNDVIEFQFSYIGA